MDASEFQKYLGGIYQNGLVMLSVALGHELGIFEFMISSNRSLHLSEIADSLDLKERYTKEWLSSMVAAGIILQDRETNMYTLPESHHPALKMAASFSPIMIVCSKRSDNLLKCFKKDGPYGISYQDSPEWFDWFDNYRSTMCEIAVDTEIIPLLSQQDGVIPKLEKGIRVIDVGCGSGRFTNTLAKRFPNSTFLGLDYSDKGIELSNQMKDSLGLKNVDFVQGDAHNLPDEYNESFDMVFVYDVLHDLPNPFKALEQIYKVLKPDGFFSLIEIGFHSNPIDNAGDKAAAMYYTCSMFICLASSMTEPPHVGYGACWGVEEIEKALKGANFKLEGKSSLVIIGSKTFFFSMK
ncbi:hypothetical protein ACF0H5_010098 [Mactra antiquata]